MSFFLPFSEYAEKAGSASADLTVKIADLVKQTGCTLWNNYPDRFTKNKQLGSSFARGFMQNMCAPDNPPPPSIPPGCATRYHIFGTFFSKNFSNGGCDQTAYWRTQLAQPASNIASYTPIVDTTNEWRIPSVTGGNHRLRVLNKTLYDADNIGDSSTPGIIFRGSTLSCLSTTQAAYGDQLVRTKIVPVPPTDPNCIDAIVYPTTNPPPIITTNRVLNIDNDTNINVAITNKTDSNQDFGFPLIFTVANFNVGLDLGGFTFSPDISNEFNFNSQPGTKQPPIARRRGPGGGGSSPGTDELVEDSKLEEDPKEEEVGPDLEYVRVELTSIPANAKTQFGAGAPNVIYAGWFEFRTVGSYYNRQPIHFLDNLFVPPPGATGYAYTLYNGFRGRATVYKIPTNPD